MEIIPRGFLLACRTIKRGTHIMSSDPDSIVKGGSDVVLHLVNSN